MPFTHVEDSDFLCTPTLRHVAKHCARNSEPFQFYDTIILEMFLLSSVLGMHTACSCKRIAPW